jgi:hypothetical protein
MVADGPPTPTLEHVNELPPDLKRLRAVLAHLDRQLTDNETVGTYLRLQRDTVQRALAAAEPAPAQQQRPEPPRQPTARPGMYLLEPKIHERHPEPPTIHTSTCAMPSRRTREISAQEARVALTQDAGAAPCEFCRPDTKLGLLE